MTPHELMEFGDWRSYAMVLKYEHCRSPLPHLPQRAPMLLTYVAAFAGTRLTLGRSFGRFDKIAYFVENYV